MYLQLFHGRESVEKDMQEWGTNGPVFEVELLLWTYGSLERILFKDQEDTHFISEYSPKDEGLFFYDGVYYGDFRITPENESEEDVIPFNESKTLLKEPV